MANVPIIVGQTHGYGLDYRTQSPSKDGSGELDKYPGAFIIAAVGLEGARELIREQMHEMDRTEVIDFVSAV